MDFERAETGSDVAGYFDAESSGWAERYSKNRHFRRRLEIVMSWLADVPSGQAYLDYGCGGGVLVRALAEAGHTVTGADISEGMLSAAEALLKSAPQHAQNVRLVKVNETFEGAYQDQLYDGVFSLGVIEYLDNPTGLITQLNDVLKPGGTLTLSFPNRESWLRRLETWIFQHPELFRALRLFPHLTSANSYLHFQKCRFSLAEMDSLMAQQGLRRQQVAYHVAPGFLGRLEAMSFVGMTAVASYEKAV